MGRWPVWTDEGWSVWAASDHTFGVIVDRLAHDRHPPLYFLALSAWSTAAGDSRLALRFLSVIGGLLTVALSYRIAADWFGEHTALITALLLSVLEVIVYYSQEIRHYGWMVVCVCLATLIFLRYLRRPRRRLAILYGVAVAFTLYTNYFGALVFPAHLLGGLILWRGPIRKKAELLAAYVLAAVLYIPWLPSLWLQLHALSSGIRWFPTSLQGLIDAGSSLFGREQLALSIGLYAFGAWVIFKRRESSARWQAQAIIVLCGGGLFAMMFILNVWLGVLTARTLLFLLPALIMVCAYALSQIERPVRILLLAVLVALALNPATITQPRLDSAAAAKAVAADYSRGDLLVLDDSWDDYAIRYELVHTIGKDSATQIDPVIAWGDNAPRETLDAPMLQTVLPQMQSELDAHRRVWVVNFLITSRLSEYLDTGGDGFQPVIRRATSVGAQYQPEFPGAVIRSTLYERPNLSERAYDFGDKLDLRDAVTSHDVAPGETLNVDLWWSALKKLPLDYSVGVYLRSPNGTVDAESDQSPGYEPTSRWPANVPIFDRHRLSVPPKLAPGIYNLSAEVYWYEDEKPLIVNGKSSLLIGAVQVDTLGPGLKPQG